MDFAIFEFMMICRHCHKEIEAPLLGLRNFCSHECKKAHRLAYQANWIKRKRDVDNKSGYLDMGFSNVDKSNPYQKPICKGKNEGHGLIEDNFSIVHLPETIKEGESIAKRYCPEYSRKEREGYCIRDGMPHEIECSVCINDKIHRCDEEIDQISRLSLMEKDGNLEKEFNKEVTNYNKFFVCRSHKT